MNDDFLARCVWSNLLFLFARGANIVSFWQEELAEADQLIEKKTNSSLRNEFLAAGVRGLNSKREVNKRRFLKESGGKFQKVPNNNWKLC